MKPLLPTLSLATLFWGCSSSRPYQPLDWEKELYESSNKTPFPNEMSDNEMGRKMHWLGIIDTFWLEPSGDSTVIWVRAAHKYWDYVEDFSIQRERMFVSPRGAGTFLYVRKVGGIPADTIQKDLSRLAHKNNLGMFYGIYAGRHDSAALMTGTKARYIHRQYYSTNLWAYDIAKDSSGKYRFLNHQVIKDPGPGINDPEDKEFE